MRHKPLVNRSNISVGPPIRRSARLIILDPAGRLLLFRYHDGHGDPFWSTVGGELKEGEDYRQAAARELKEQTSLLGELSTLQPLTHVIRSSESESYAELYRSY